MTQRMTSKRLASIFLARASKSIRKGGTGSLKPAQRLRFLARYLTHRSIRNAAQESWVPWVIDDECPNAQWHRVGDRDQYDSYTAALMTLVEHQPHLTGQVCKYGENPNHD